MRPRAGVGRGIFWPAQGRWSRPGRLFWQGIWLGYLAVPAHQAVTSFSPAVAAVVVTVLVIFGGLYLLTVNLAAGERPTQRGALLALAALGALTLGCVAAVGPGSAYLFIYVGVAGAGVFPLARALPGIAAISVVSVIAAAAADLDSGDTLFVGVETFSISVMVLGIRRLKATIAELRTTRTEMAELAAAEAVSEERLRFARDLHDLLGHSLSVIALKSELARRLLDQDVPAAAREVADVESVARRALVDVRAAVSGYRERPLRAELDDAEGALATAGIDMVLALPDTPLPPDTQNLLGWAIREGVTNVVRHSRASHCSITLRRETDKVWLEIVDDGIGPSMGASGGTGLRGLKERMAIAGGRLETGPAPGHGFRLAVTLPAAAIEAALAPPAGRPAAQELSASTR